MQLTDDNVQSSNSRLVDVEWETLYSINGKNISKLMQPKFLITLTLLCQGDFKTGGAVETVPFTSKRNQLTIKRVKFECNLSELQYLHLKIKQACNAVTLLTRESKDQIGTKTQSR